MVWFRTLWRIYEKKPNPNFYIFIFFWLPELHLKTSNTHNFWSLGPKNTKFILPRSVLHSPPSQKVSKNPKIYCTCRSLPKSAKTSFRADCPLGVKALCKNSSIISLNLALLCQPQLATTAKLVCTEIML
jgi:hypothetical protein